MIYDGPLIHIGIAIAAGTVAAVLFYFKGRRDERRLRKPTFEEWKAAELRKTIP
jgi:hypothetical protein